MSNVRAMSRAEFALRLGSKSSRTIGSLCASVAFFAVALTTGRAAATEYYVAPTGNDSNSGSLAAPFATLQKGNDVAAAGDTVWLRAGTYSSTTQVVLSKSGTSDTNRTKIWAYQNEKPILDCSRYESTGKASDVPCIYVTGSCDSHDNYDKNGSQGDGQNGDGFGVHYQTSGPSTTIRGCRSWLDSDDGYDDLTRGSGRRREQLRDSMRF